MENESKKLSFVKLHKEVIQEHQLSSMVNSTINRQHQCIEESIQRLITEGRSFCLFDTLLTNLSLMNSVDIFFSPIYQRLKEPFIYESPSSLPLQSDVTIGINNFLKYVYTPPIAQQPQNPQEGSKTKIPQKHWLTNYSSFMPIFLHCVVKYFHNSNSEKYSEVLNFNPFSKQESFFSCSTFPSLFGYCWCVEQGAAYVHAILELMKIQITNRNLSQNFIPKSLSDSKSHSEFDILPDEVIKERIESFEFRNSFIWTIIRQFLHMTGIQEYLRASLSINFWAFANDEFFCTPTTNLVRNRSFDAFNTKASSGQFKKRQRRQVKTKCPSNLDLLKPLPKAPHPQIDALSESISPIHERKKSFVHLLKYTNLFIEGLLKNISQMPSLVRYFFYKLGAIDKSKQLIEYVFFDYLLQPAIFNPKLFALIPETATAFTTSHASTIARILKCSLHPERIENDEYKDLLTENPEENDKNCPFHLFKSINASRIITALSSKSSLDQSLSGANATKIQQISNMHHNFILMSANDVAFIIKIIKSEIGNINIFDEIPDDTKPAFIDHVHIKEKAVLLKKLSFDAQMEFSNQNLIDFWYKSYKLPEIKITRPSSDKRRKDKSSKSTTASDDSPTTTVNDNIKLKDERSLSKHKLNALFSSTPQLHLPLFNLNEIEEFNPKDPYIKTIYHLANYLQMTKPYQSRSSPNSLLQSPTSSVVYSLTEDGELTLLSFLDGQRRHATRIKSLEWVTRTQAIFNKIQNMGKTEEDILSTLSNIVNYGLKKSSDNLAISFVHQEIINQLKSLIKSSTDLTTEIMPIAYQNLLKRFVTKNRTILMNIFEQEDALSTNKNQWKQYFADMVNKNISQFIQSEIEKPTNEKGKKKTKPKKKHIEDNVQRITDPTELATIKFNLVRQFHSEICSKHFTFKKYVSFEEANAWSQDKKLQDNYDKLLTEFIKDSSNALSSTVRKLLSQDGLFDLVIEDFKKGIDSGAPLERFEQIRQTVDRINRIYVYESGDKASADDLLPLFIFVLLRASIPNLISLLHYLDHFLFSLSEIIKILDNVEQYTMTTFVTSVNLLITDSEKL